MKSQSDEMWSASPDFRFLFRDLLSNASTYPSNFDVQAILFYEFDRKLPETARKASGNIPVEVKNLTEFNALSKVNCSETPDKVSTITLESLIPSRVRLGETSTAQPLIIDDPDYSNIHNVSLEYSCRNFWMLNQYNTTGNQGIEI